MTECLCNRSQNTPKMACSSVLSHCPNISSHTSNTNFGFYIISHRHQQSAHLSLTHKTTSLIYAISPLDPPQPHARTVCFPGEGKSSRSWHNWKRKLLNHFIFTWTRLVFHDLRECHFETGGIPSATSSPVRGSLGPSPAAVTLWIRHPATATHNFLFGTTEPSDWPEEGCFTCPCTWPHFLICHWVFQNVSRYCGHRCHRRR